MGVRDSATAIYQIEPESAHVREDEVPPGYKRTEVGMIPEDWDISSIGVEFNIQLGKMLDAEKNAGQLKPFLGNRAVQWNHIDTSDLAEIRLTPSDLQRYRLKAGDLLVCEGGEIGRSAIWQDDSIECYYQKALHRLRPKKKYSADLIVSILLQYATNGFLHNFATQTSIAHLPKDKLETIPIPQPSDGEQEIIVEALGDADALIESLQQLIAKKRAIKQGAMQALLTGRKRLSGFADEWQSQRIEDVADVKTGPFGSALHEKDYVSFGTPIITVEHLGELRITRQNLPRVSDVDRLRLRAYLLETGDVVFSRVGSVDRNAVITAGEHGWLFSGRLLRVRFDRKRVFPEFANFYFRSEGFRNSVLALAVGQTMASLSTAILNSLSLMVPSLDEQVGIAVMLCDMDTEIEALEARLAKTRALKAGMMQALLTGRIRLPLDCAA